MKENVINMLKVKQITFKEYAVYTMLATKRYTINELADYLELDRANTYRTFKKLEKVGLLNYNYDTKQYWAKEDKWTGDKGLWNQ